MENIKFEDYKKIHSETIMYYQLIESDLKIIYSLLKNNNFLDSYLSVEKLPLGVIVEKLKKFDLSKNKNFLSHEDYNFLSQITKNRNYWAHDNFIEFLYSNDFENSKEYIRSSKRLLKDNERVRNVSLNVEKIKIDLNQKINN
ncbi:MAG: hypothetical protein K2H56_01995 [Malacoplasma sp.]|nr:hypothetical protein [Malacoplasma sp.]